MKDLIFLVDFDRTITMNDSTDELMNQYNPQMVDDTKEALKSKGLTMNRRGVGNIAVENYW